MIRSVVVFCLIMAQIAVSGCTRGSASCGGGSDSGSPPRSNAKGGPFSARIRRIEFSLEDVRFETADNPADTESIIIAGISRVAELERLDGTVERLDMPFSSSGATAKVGMYFFEARIPFVPVAGVIYSGGATEFTFEGGMRRGQGFWFLHMWPLF